MAETWPWPYLLKTAGALYVFKKNVSNNGLWTLWQGGVGSEGEDSGGQDQAGLQRDAKDGGDVQGSPLPPCPPCKDSRGSIFGPESDEVIGKQEEKHMV